MDRPGEGLPWIEKYRPRTIEEVSSQEEVVKALRSCLETRQFPHLLFYGPAGTGKTSTILALCRQLFGSVYKDRVLELNASDERGIGVVREKIKSFAARQATSTATIPGFKVIVLDEADAMTRDAQTALRRTMEIFSSVTRFCLVCNYVSRIIEPLASRCAKFRFNALPGDIMITRLNGIALKEQISIHDDVIRSLVEFSGGDMRKAVSMMQTLHAAYQAREITAKDVVECAGRVDDAAIMRGLETLKSRSVDALQEWVQSIIYDGYSPDAAARQLAAAVAQATDLDEMKKASICLKLHEVEARLARGSDGFCQLLDGVVFASTVMHEIS